MIYPMRADLRRYHGCPGDAVAFVVPTFGDMFEGNGGRAAGDHSLRHSNAQRHGRRPTVRSTFWVQWLVIGFLNPPSMVKNRSGGKRMDGQRDDCHSRYR